MRAALAIKRRNTWRDTFEFSVFNGIAWADQLGFFQVKGASTELRHLHHAFP
jgi:hypothetical protein